MTDQQAKLYSGQQKLVDAFNNKHQVGDAVAWISNVGNHLPTKTRSKAVVLGGHTACVLLEQHVGYIPLDRVTEVNPLIASPKETREMEG